MSTLSPPSFCDSCGAALRPQAKYCPACGHRRLVSPSAAGTGLLGPHSLLKQRYRIRRKLGQGGMAAVYQAEDLLFDRALRAIKEMSQSELSPQELQEAVAEFKQEAMLLASLVHPHLPRIYDYFEERGHWYLVMDFIEGATLEARLHHAHQGKLPMRETVAIGIQLCNVLSYLHTRQPPIIFRDLKPANVMLTPENTLYLIDFGISRRFKPGQAKDTMLLGSPGYAAPEQYGKAQTTPQSDIYSLGATLHQVLSGRDPTQNPFQFPPLHLGPSAPAHALAALVLRMVNLDKDRRPTSVLVVKRELQRIEELLVAGTGAFASATLPASPPAIRGASPPPKTKEQWLHEGTHHYGAGRTAEALEAYAHALQVDPQDGAAWHAKGDALRSLHRGTEALAAYDQAIRLDPMDASAWYKKGNVLLELRQYEEAVRAYDQALHRNPSDAAAHYNKGCSLYSMSKYEEAVAAFDQATRFQPNFAPAYGSKGLALAALQHLEEALTAFDRAIALNPDDAVAYYYRGKALWDLKRHKEAMESYDQAIRLNPRMAANAP